MTFTPTIAKFFKQLGRMIPYTEFKYIFPPRAESALPDKELPNYDNGRYGGQPKMDGNCSILFTNGIDCIFMDRHKENFSKTPLRLSDGTLLKLHRETICEGVDKNKWMVLVGEYMAKSKQDDRGDNFNDNFVIFDILVFDGVHLVGSTFEERIHLLDELYGTSDLEVEESGVRQHKWLLVTPVPHCYRVKTIFEDFRGAWKQIVETHMLEGLVLKRLTAGLEAGIGIKNNTSSQFKFRKPTKNFSF